jgi:hypothetical protein
MSKKLILIWALTFCLISVSYSQNFSSTTSYQLGKSAEYYGVSISKWLKTWNNDKVILRGTASYLIGNNRVNNSEYYNYNRIEFGLDSRNTMVTGKDFFNIINISYIISKYQNNQQRTINENGWMYSIGIGTRLTSPLIVSTSYVFGIYQGIRVSFGFDF